MLKTFARPYYQALSVFIDQRLAHTAEALKWDWPRFLLWSVIIAGLLAAAAHLIQMYSIGSQSIEVRWLGVGGVMSIAVACVILQAWSLWQTRLDPTQSRPYVVALLMSAVTIALCIEVFAGLTLMLSPLSRMAEEGPAWELWAAEKFYLWHLADSLPILNVPQAIGWPEPLILADRNGALVLLFKIVLIVPLVRIAIAGYELLEGRRLAAVEREYQRALRDPRPFRSSLQSEGDVWPAALCVFAAAAVLLACLLFLIDDSSAINRWLASHLQPGLDVFSVHIPLGWLQPAMQWMVLVAMAVMFFFVADIIDFSQSSRARSASAVVGGLVVYIGVLVTLTMGWAAVTLALLHVGLAGAEPTIPPEREVIAVLNAYSWAVANAVPGVRIPEAIQWSPAYKLTGLTSGLLLVSFKLAILAVLAFPIARIVRAYFHRSRPRQLSAPTLTAASRYMTLLHSATAMLDKVELIARQEALSRSGSLAFLRGYTTWLEVDRCIDQIETTLTEVAALFGEEVNASADGAFTAALHRRTLVRELSSPFRLSKRNDIAEECKAAKAQLAQCTHSYTEAANAFLVSEAANVRNSAASNA